MGSSDLPPGWSWTELGSLVSSARPGFKCGKRDDNGFVQIRANNIGLRGAVVSETLLRVPRSLADVTRYGLRRGDVLFNNTNTAKLVGKTALFAGELSDCVYSNHITRLRVSEGLVEPSLLAWFLVLQQREGTFERLSHRSVSQATVSGRDLLSLQVPLPPSAEQLRMGTRLRALLGELRTASQSLEKAQARLGQIRQSIPIVACRGELTAGHGVHFPGQTTLASVRDEFQERLDGSGGRRNELSSDEKERFRQIEVETVPFVPDSWTLVRLSSLAELRRGKAVKRPLSKGSIPVYGGNGPAGRQSEPLVANPTLVIGRVGSSCGNVHLTRGPAWITDNALFASWVNPAVSFEYLALFLQQLRINGLSGGTGQPYLSKDLLYRLLIAVPSIMEQNEIVRKASQLLAVLSRVEEATGRGIRRSFELERAILEKAFRGQLAPQDPEDEPASVLLGKLRAKRPDPAQVGETSRGRE